MELDWRKAMLTPVFQVGDGGWRLRSCDGVWALEDVGSRKTRRSCDTLVKSQDGRSKIPSHASQRRRHLGQANWELLSLARRSC